jgi:hypothetical protein
MMIRADLGYWTGLGNQLFLLAATESFAKQTGRKYYVRNLSTPYNPHSSTNFFHTILKNFIPLSAQPEGGETLIYEDGNFQNKYVDWVRVINEIKTPNLMVRGSFQDWKYIEPVYHEFIQRLSFNTDVEKKYPQISEYTFIHVRGGDYLDAGDNFVDLTKYYQNCLDIVGRKNIVVFTNDEAYTRKVLTDVEYVVIKEGPEDTLYLMSRCKAAIISDSTFSWWGAYLNRNRPIFMPSRWFHKKSTSSFQFPGTSIVGV